MATENGTAAARRSGAVRADRAERPADRKFEKKKVKNRRFLTKNRRFFFLIEGFRKKKWKVFFKHFFVKIDFFFENRRF